MVYAARLTPASVTYSPLSTICTLMNGATLQKPQKGSNFYNKSNLEYQVFYVFNEPPLLCTVLDYSKFLINSPNSKSNAKYNQVINHIRSNCGKTFSDSFMHAVANTLVYINSLEW